MGKREEREKEKRERESLSEEDERKFLASSSQALFVLRFAFLGITFFVSESRLFLHDKLGRAITRSFCERIWSRSTIFDRALPLHCE